MAGTPDLGKIVQLIMENPGLIEEISKLASPDTQSEPASEAPRPALEEVKATETVTPALPATQAKPNRTELLGALKPYVSAERAKAIDSMISVAQILDMMKAR